MSTFKKHDETAEDGLILMDLSRKPIAIDPGADAIFARASQSGFRLEPASWLPQEFTQLFGRSEGAERSPLQAHVQIGPINYACTAYRLECQIRTVAQPVIAIHLARAVDADTIYDLIEKYQLTARELEVLRGILTGLANKELAVRMKISPNTVKAFLRLIMIKMGVTTRSEMFAKVFSDIIERRSRETGSLPLPTSKRQDPKSARTTPQRFSAAGGRSTASEGSSRT
jgi:DNA-binding CsgD family transcriptional regulator